MNPLDIFGVVFGLFAAISGLLRGASFTTVDREKYPMLKKLDGKKLPLFISTFVFLILTAVTQIIQVTTKPSFEQTQGPGGQTFEKATLTGFKEELREETVELESEAEDYFNSAERDFAAGLYWDAVNSYQKSISVISTMSAYLNLSISLYFLSEYDRADEAFTSGLQIAVKKRDRKLEAPFRSGLGNVYFRQGKYEEALKSLQDALATFKEIGNPLGQANDLMNIGNVYFNQGKLEEALKLLNEARAIFSQVGATGKLQLVERMIAQLETAMK